MIARVRPDPADRESGTEWPGDLPAHWSVQRLRDLCDLRVSNVDKHSKDHEQTVRLCNYVDVYRNDYIHSRMRFMHATATTEEIERFRLQVGDVLITKDSETWDDIGVPAVVRAADADMVCGYHLALLRPRPDAAQGDFIFRTLQSRPIAYQFHIAANGITRYGLSQGSIKAVCLPVPPAAEQAAVVRFLDHADRRIQRYIRAKEELIRLLEEQKQAVIRQAVTGQIDVRTGEPYSAYKDSGVGWLGKVPETWECRRLKTLLRPVDHRSVHGSETLLSLRRDHGVVIYAEHFSRPSQADSLVGFKLVVPEQLVVNRLQANNGLVFRSALAGLVSPDYSVFERTIRANTRYLSDLLRTLPYRAHFRRQATGLGTGTAGFLRIYDDDFLATPVALPSTAEQTAIVAYMDHAVARAGTSADRARRQIDLIREYRTRLVADVVTGKLDVREAAAALPDRAPA